MIGLKSGVMSVMPAHCRSRVTLSRKGNSSSMWPHQPFLEIQGRTRGVDAVGIAGTAHHQLAAGGLGDVDMQAAGDDDLIQERLQRHGDAGLQRDGADRQLEAGHLGDQRGGTGHRLHGAIAVDGAAVGVHALDGAVLDQQAGDFGLRMDMHAAHRRTPRIAPGHGIMAGDRARRVVERAEHGIARILRQVHRRAEPRDVLADRSARN